MSTNKASSAKQLSSLNRVPLVLALVLAIALVVGVLVGARVVYDRAARQPVVMSVIDSPDADSAACADFVSAAPDKLAGHRRVGIADPAPAGAAAWASDSTRRITVRCGVSLPLQYTTLSTTVSAAGASWLQVKDNTPGSSLETWYSVDRFPAVAVTATAEAVGSAATPVDELGTALGSLDTVEPQPHPAPLTQLQAAPTSEHCAALMAAVPNQLGRHTRIDAAASAAAGLPEHTIAWTAEGEEPVVLRCGVAAPPGYAPGAQLQQVEGVPWFEDATLANGTTAGTWFALGRSTDVAVSMPQSVGNAAIVELSTAIAKNLPEA